MKRTLLVFLLVYAGQLFGQDQLSDGYALLDAQEYESAEQFFEQYIVPESKTARICHARAIGLGGDAVRALDLIVELSSDYSNDYEVKLNLGEAYLWNNRPTEAIHVYDALLRKDSLNFVANLGYANAQASLAHNDIALKYIEKAILIDPQNHSAHISRKFIMIAKAYSLYKNGDYNAAFYWLKRIEQVDPENVKAAEIRQLIKSKIRTEFQAQYTNTSDAGGNDSRIYHVDSAFNLTNRHRISVNASLQESFFTQSKTARQQAISLSDQYHLNKMINIHLGYGISASQSENLTLNRGLLNGAVECFFSERLYTKVQYTSEVHNYTVDLIKSDILMRHFSWATNYMLSKKMGFYLNGVYSRQSDNNARKLIYGSLYYSLVSLPLVRLGINYSYFGFEEMRDNYFSPERYQLGECFMMIDNAQADSKLKYKIQISFGAQKMIEQEYQAISRIEATAAYHFENGLFGTVKYLTSSAAAATAIGQYLYKEWAVSLGCRF